MLRAAAASVPPGWTLELADISELPVFNDDLNNDEDRPASVQRFKAQVQRADAILISSPEHNFGVATATKNALDWASTKPNCWDDKVSRPSVDLRKSSPDLVNASLLPSWARGMHGSGRAQYHFRQLAVFVNLHMLNKPEVMINVSSSPCILYLPPLMVGAALLWGYHLRRGGEPGVQGLAGQSLAL